ncbi:MAG: asparagine synthase (glutamine-hydrolyzing) [Pseudomonadota bacterium]
MCGIVGGTNVLPQYLESAIRKIHHRGPDASGLLFLNEGHVGMGHVRLAIIDLDDRAKQPMVCSRTGNVLTFNGEIYNYRAIRQTLVKLGWEFRTHSDTEVLLAAYGQWGMDCLKHFNGMFAFAIYDPSRKRIFLARDRVGKKPLYYSLWNNEFIWGSEIKALLAVCPELPCDIDSSALKEYMDIGYIPGGASIYKKIHKLKPAHYATYDLDSQSFSQHRYWSLPSPLHESITENEAIEELERILLDAVRIRLESDVPVGAFLSGGLDSSLITAMIAKENPELVAYTASFPVAEFDESAIAKHVAEWLGIKHQILPIKANSIDLLEKLAWQFDEPFADSSLLPTYLISQAIRQHVKVALSGDGGDELFAGYDSYAETLQEEKWKNIPKYIRAMLFYFHHLLPLGVRGKNFLRRLPFDGIECFMNKMCQTELITLSPLNYEIDSALKELPKNDYRQEVLKTLKVEQLDCSTSLLQEMTRLDFFSYLPDDILVKVDRASMLTSLEVRSPLLDYRIVEFAYTLPDEFRLNGITRKYLLKKLARKYLPPDFPFERKKGFSIPVSDWFKGEWRNFFDKRSKNNTSFLLDASNINKIQQFHDKKSRYGHDLFKILMLKLFEDSYGYHIKMGAEST